MVDEGCTLSGEVLRSTLAARSPFSGTFVSPAPSAPLRAGYHHWKDRAWWWQKGNVTGYTWLAGNYFLFLEKDAHRVSVILASSLPRNG